MTATLPTTAARPLWNHPRLAQFDELICANRGCRVGTFTRGADGCCPACGMPGRERWQVDHLG